MSGSRIDWVDYLDGRVSEQESRHKRVEEEHAAINQALEMLRMEQARTAAVSKTVSTVLALIATSAIALCTWLVRTSLQNQERLEAISHTVEDSRTQLRELGRAIARVEGKLDR